MSNDKMEDVTAMLGKTVHGWHLTETLGRGIDGVVYLGTKNSIIAAVKLFFPETLLKNGLDGGIERLELQLSLAGKKHHPNLVEIFEGNYDTELETIYIVMEYIPGKSLDKILMEIPRALIPSLVEQLASATKFLDSMGLVHRDIKPANIVISSDFKSLTLLDLGIVLSVTNTDDSQRFSGDEFVASLRYSPPEFVWRTEVGSDIEAWKAITFYQMGATIHDMVMQKPLFSGFDTPRAKLYDAVRLVTPVISSDDCPEWLLQTIRASLVKNWQERNKLLTWESFSPPNTTSPNLQIQAIKLKQIQKEEQDTLRSETSEPKPIGQSNNELWNLQDKLFLIIRQFVISATIFPKFSGNRTPRSNQHYEFNFRFEKDTQLMFDEILEVKLSLKPNEESTLLIDLDIVGTFGKTEIFKGSWSEMLTHEAAESLCTTALTQMAEHITSRQ